MRGDVVDLPIPQHLHPEIRRSLERQQELTLAVGQLWVSFSQQAQAAAQQIQMQQEKVKDGMREMLRKFGLAPDTNLSLDLERMSFKILGEVPSSSIAKILSAGAPVGAPTLPAVASAAKEPEAKK